MTEVFIIGGGASGMAAALSAAQHPNRRVTLLERQGRVGRKLLATGNGRCNLTNLAGADIAHYHGAAPAFAGGALRRYPPEAVLDFFSALGLMTRPEYGGRVYPMSGHAGSVLDVLLLALEQAGVRVCTAAAVQCVARRGGRFWLETAAGGMTADKLIVACGGCAGGKLGGVQDGYTLLQGLGHSRTALSPALTALRTAPDYPRALKGIRADAVVRLLCGGRTLQTERGDVLFTENGVSGTAVFAVSRAAADVGKAQAEISLNFFSGFGCCRSRADAGGTAAALAGAARKPHPDRHGTEPSGVDALQIFRHQRRRNGRYADGRGAASPCCRHAGLPFAGFRRLRL